MSRLRRRLPEGDEGFSLVELLAAMLVAALLLTALTITTVAIQRSSAATVIRQDGSRQDRQAMERMTRVLKAATGYGSITKVTAFASAADTDVTFFANTDTSAIGPTKVRLYVDSSGNLQQVLTPPDSSPTGGTEFTYTGASTTKVLATGIKTTLPLFRYLDATGAAAPTICTSTGVPTGCTSSLATPVATASLPNIVGVQIQLVTAGGTAYKIPDVSLIDRVVLPNALYGGLNS